MIEKLEALLAALTPGQLSRCRPADVRRLADALYANHVLAMMHIGQEPFSKVAEKTCGETRTVGVLRQLKAERMQTD